MKYILIITSLVLISACTKSRTLSVQQESQVIPQVTEKHKEVVTSGETTSSERSEKEIDISSLSEEEYDEFKRDGKIDPDFVTIEEYYSLIGSGKLTEAYEMSSKKIGKDKFFEVYNQFLGGKLQIYIYNLKKTGNGEYHFLINIRGIPYIWQEYEAKRKVEIYEVSMKSSDGKIISSLSTPWVLEKLFTSKKGGIGMIFPNGYILSDDGVYFGQLTTSLGPISPKFDNIFPESTFSIVSKSDSPSYDNLIKENGAKQININGIKGVEFYDGGYCGGEKTVLFGKDYNYEFYTLCAHEESDLVFENYREIIKTMSFRK